MDNNDRSPDIEEWRDIAGWENFYRVSSLGRVRSLPRRIECRGHAPVKFRRGKILTLNRKVTGYLAARLCRDGFAESVAVHRLVCFAFHGPQPSEDHEVAHWDGSRDNNRADNLRWATRVENAADKFRHGTVYRGGGYRVIDAATAAQIKRRLNAGEMQKEITASLGLKRGVVGHIARGKTWAHIS